ncbi:MAG TPA: septum site-determining protein MinC, partial [Desulfopila sp.]|nr:septum site-determining protein MinC [Desulfopila sp.]
MNFTVETRRKDLPREDMAVAMRGRMVSITAIEVSIPDLEEIGRQLREKSRQAPSFFKGAPLLLDLTNLKVRVDLTWLGKAYALMVQNDFMALGVAGADPTLAEEARKGGIPIWPSPARRGDGEEPAEGLEDPFAAEDEKDPAVESKPISEPEEPPDERPGECEKSAAETLPPDSFSPTRVVTAPVRSGQRCYAKGGDLIILASVNTGAEIMADGHIHVYGSLRGRALAGVGG